MFSLYGGLIRCISVRYRNNGIFETDSGIQYKRSKKFVLLKEIHSKLVTFSYCIILCDTNVFSLYIHIKHEEILKNRTNLDD